MNIFGYLQWDPSPEMFQFTIPFLNRPILWYGFFFALGFFIAYWILHYILIRYLLEFPKFQKKDINNWPSFLNYLQKSKSEKADRILHHLDQETKKNLQNTPIEEKTKNGVVHGLNELLHEPQHQPSSLRSLFSYAKKKNLKQECTNRIALEEIFSPYLFKIKKRTTYIAEKMTFYVVLGTIIGARLADVFFYQNFSQYLSNPLGIIKVWQGGLASHGGVIGIIVALFLLSLRLRKEYPMLSFLVLLDLTVIPTPIVCCLIRIGNFFNQEILGTVTNVPWAIIFMHPADGSAALPRHPVQLYESLFYFLMFFVVAALWRCKSYRPGKITGLFLVIAFIFRFFIEYFKLEQSAIVGSHSLFTMGQILSLPIILLGAWLFFRK